MRPNGSKPAPLRLDPVSYENLRQLVLRRDGWRCQSCGRISNVEIHHKLFRSQSGEDSETNLITLCVRCHQRMHIRRENG
jgi:5-methylcytosine-specific restriction endonuclease McrA